MPIDITMCSGRDCPIRMQCYRYRGVPEGRQDAFGVPPYDAGRGACNAFWDVATLEPTTEAIRVRAYYLWVAAGRPEGADVAHWEAAKAEVEAAARRLLT